METCWASSVHRSAPARAVRLLTYKVSSKKSPSKSKFKHHQPSKKKNKSPLILDKKHPPQKKNKTLLRVIPTITFQNSHVRFYVSLIGSGEGRHTTYVLKCVLLLLTWQTDWKQLSDSLSDLSFDILFDISSDICSDILSDISFDILSDTSSACLFDICFDILSDISSDISTAFFDISFDILSHILSDISFDILSDISSNILSDIQYILTFFLTYLLTYLLRFYLFNISFHGLSDFLSDISFNILSGISFTFCFFSWCRVRSKALTVKKNVCGLWRAKAAKQWKNRKYNQVCSLVKGQRKISMHSSVRDLRPKLFQNKSQMKWPPIGHVEGTKQANNKTFRKKS